MTLAEIRYHATDPAEKAFGGRVEITLADGEVIAEDIAVADAHPLGARPFTRPDYVGKFRTLAENVVEGGEQDRFLNLAGRLAELTADEVAALSVTAAPGILDAVARVPGGIF